MLSFFRKGGSGQIVVGAIVFSIIIVFMLEFRPGRGAKTNLENDCSIEVNGVCLTRKDFYAAYGLVVPRVEPSQLKGQKVGQRVAEGLVERELLVAEADRLGISTTPETVEKNLLEGKVHVSLPVTEEDSALAHWGLCKPSDMFARRCEPGTEMTRRIPVESTKSGQFDYTIYERNVRQMTNRSPKEFKESQIREIKAARVRELVASRVQVSMDEAFARYRMKNSTAEAKILRAPREWFVRYGLELTDAAVGDWVKDNAAAADAAWTTAKDTFKAGCLLVEDVTAVGSGEAGTDKTKLKAQIDAAKAELDAGVTFDVVARRYNAAEDAFPSFGVHCLAEDAPQTLKDAAAKLDAGKVSGVVELENGFAILKGHGKLAAEDVEKVGRDAENHRVAARFLADKRVADFVAEVEQELTKGTGVEEALKLCVERFQVKLKSTSTASAAMASAATVAEVRPKVDASGAFTLYDAPIPDVVGGESATVKAFSLNVGERARFTQRSGMALLILTAKKEVTREDFAKDGQSFTDELRRDRQREAVTRYVLALRKKSEKKIHIVPSLLEEPKQSHE